MKRKIFFIIIDLLFVVLAFLLVAWYKPGTIARVISFYFDTFLIFLGVWFITSLVTGKYDFRKKFKIRDILVAIFISNATVMAIVTTMIYFFALFGYSRLIVFGTIILSTMFEVVMGILLYFILTARRIDPTVDLDYLLLKGKKRDNVLVPHHVIREVEQHLHMGHHELPKQLKGLILSEYGEDVYRFIELNATSDIGLKNVVSTTSRFNIITLAKRKYNCLINLHRINDIQRVNKFFEAVNGKLEDKGIFIGKAETLSMRKARILKRHVFPLNYVYYIFDFIFRRIFPKVPGLHKLYFAITKGRNRLMSRAETLGRLCSCGFVVLNEQLIGDELYFMARKSGKPHFPENPTYGPLVRLNRIGKGGKMFEVYKMRTMHPFSEYLQSYVYEKSQLQDGGKFKNDFRVSTLGRIMRKIWLDEVPMLINVLKGEMKIVGVRPLSRQYFDLYNEKLKEKRIKHKPGLIPPFYADMPKTLEEIQNSELRYLEAYEKHPLATDIKYFFIAWQNIAFRNARSN